MILKYTMIGVAAGLIEFIYLYYILKFNDYLLPGTKKLFQYLFNLIEFGIGIWIAILCTEFLWVLI